MLFGFNRVSRFPRVLDLAKARPAVPGRPRPWQEVKSILPHQDIHILKAYFSPAGDIGSRVLR